MNRLAFAILVLSLGACGDSEPLEKTGTLPGNVATNNGGPANNTASNNSVSNNSASNNSASNNGPTNNTNGVPDPMFENPCESGPLDAPIAGCAPELLPTTGDSRDDCVRRINQFRWECQCLPPLERWIEGEQCADEQAEYDRMNLKAHKGFSDNICSPRGMAQNECPSWNSWDHVNGSCLQMMWDEGPGENFQEHGHYINMSSRDFTRVACGSGGDWYVQNFR